MASPNEIIKNLVSEIGASVDAFDKTIPNAQRAMMAEVDLLVKELETSPSGNIVANAKNLKLVGKIQYKLAKIVKSPEYRAAVKDYVASFKKVGQLNDEYFKALVKDYKQPAVVEVLKTQSIDATLNSLLDAGISANVTSKIEEILRINISSGASYPKMAQQLRDFLTNNGTGVGALQRYTKQITTDALNQYSAQYVRAVSHELGFDWFRYTGAEIETSRPFCKALLDKKFFHISEIPDLLAGNFIEFKDNDGKINQNTGLPEGMVKGENKDNFFVYRGGYNCGHQIVGVPEASVPKVLRIDTYTQQGIKYNPQTGMRLAA